MLHRYSLIAMLFVSLFAFNGCFVGTSGVRYASSASIAYYGAHPVLDAAGDADWCPISGVHYHAYSPGSDEFFVLDSGRYVFIGDPSYYVSNVSFNTYYYMGVHPLPVATHWCYINGPHRHHWNANGYYNYTRYGNYNYYTYYGARNRYYQPSHRHYDLHSYYSAHPPVRYYRTGRVSAGMSRPYAPAPGYRPNPGNRPNPGMNPGNANNRPTTSRPSTGTTRPSTGYDRPTTSRPSTGTTRPSTGYDRPTTSRPSTGTTRPSTGYDRPTTSRPSTGTSRPSTGRAYPSASKGQYVQGDDDENGNSRGRSSRSSVGSGRRGVPTSRGVPTRR